MPAFGVCSRATRSNQSDRSSARIKRRRLILTVLSRRLGSGSSAALRKNDLLTPTASAAPVNPYASFLPCSVKFIVYLSSKNPVRILRVTAYYDTIGWLLDYMLA